jgi:MinD-like ATPase involved in chromosome partitioning or flagellar assembly
VLIACWSAKGGSGTTVVAAALALSFARSPSGAVLADLAGDAACVLGLPEPEGPGLHDWLGAGDDVPADALSRLAVPAAPGLVLLPRGTATADAPARADVLASLLLTEPRTVVADCGVLATGAARAVAAAASASLLVVRPCYVALRRALAAPLRPSGVVLVSEPGRALGRRDVEDVLGVPVRAEIDVEPAVARAVDAGLLSSRLPRSLERALRNAA